MRIGFSLGRCLRDIVNGHVSVDEVAFLITGTRVSSIEAMNDVIDEYGYREDYLINCDVELAKEVAAELWDSGRILQPRLEGIHRHQQPAHSIWVDMFPTELSDNEAVKAAWEAYRFTISMVKSAE